MAARKLGPRVVCGFRFAAHALRDLLCRFSAPQSRRQPSQDGFRAAGGSRCQAAAEHRPPLTVRVALPTSNLLGPDLPSLASAAEHERTRTCRLMRFVQGWACRFDAPSAPHDHRDGRVGGGTVLARGSGASYDRRHGLPYKAPPHGFRSLRRARHVLNRAWKPCFAPDRSASLPAGSAAGAAYQRCR